MKLTIPNIKQEKDQLLCAASCIAMLFTYYKINVPYEELSEELKKQTAYFSMPLMGELFLSYGFHVRIVTLHPDLFTLDYRTKAPRDLRDHFEHLLQFPSNKKNKDILTHFVSFMTKGGTVVPDIPSFERICRELDHGRPVLGLMSTRFRNDGSSSMNYHYNVVTGYNKSSIFINDPVGGMFGGPQKKKAKHYFHGIYAGMTDALDYGSILLLRKVSDGDM